MCLLRTCEKPSFKRLITGLTGSNDSIIPNRRQLSKHLDNKYETYVSILMDLIAKEVLFVQWLIYGVQTTEVTWVMT